MRLVYFAADFCQFNDGFYVLNADFGKRTIICSWGFTYIDIPFSNVEMFGCLVKERSGKPLFDILLLLEQCLALSKGCNNYTCAVLLS